MAFSFFRSFNKTLCASRFTKPNNILLTHCGAPVYLCSSREPSIDHLNTLKSLFKIINKLESHSKNANYQKIVNRELEDLRNRAQIYVENCVRYVQNGGRLTAQGLANLYACADHLKVNDKWLEIYAQPQIPHLLRYMSVDNLKDVQEGLRRNNGSADFSGLVENQLKSRQSNQQYQYVKRAVNEISQFEEISTPLSRNLLLNSIQSKKSPILYQAYKIWQFQLNFINSYLKRPTGYVLE